MSKIGDILKEHGLDVAEEMTAQIVKATFKILPVIAKSTPNKFDDLLIPVLSVLEPKVLALVDKIDGEDDPDR
jgi:hypothetical protein